MIELTFTVNGQGERRTVEGKLDLDGDHPVVREQHENRPDWRVESDRSVTLLSANTGHEGENFGSDAVMSGYCLSHNVNIEDLPDRDHCPYCRMERDREAQLVERATRHHPKVVDDPASIDAYRR